MTSHKTGTHEEWLAARLELLEAEKELTRRGDEVSRRRQELPWVRVDKDYRFETDEGTASLTDLFRGRSQLLAYHFMFGPDYTSGCPSCSAIADGFNGFVVHLASHDVTLCAVSRAPLENIQAYQRRMGWSFPWASSYGSDFSFDLQTASTPEQQQSGTGEYNFRPMDMRLPLEAGKEGPLAEWAATCGTDFATYARERPVSARSRSRTASSITPTPPTRAAWTACGACTSGWTGHHGDETRRVPPTPPSTGTAATTSTTTSDGARLANV
jgi:predicted dithiol-disulfide oxidoreductase (DUF899 family)